MKQRDLILIPFPFSDQTGFKVRPGIVVSNEKFNKTSEDVIICAITSNTEKSRHTVLIEQRGIEAGLLYQKSAVKCESILKIRKSMVIKTIGTVKIETLEKVLENVKSVLEP